MRQLAADAEIPTPKQATPYPDHQKVSSGYLKHMTECFVGTITGAGGAGGTLDVPFDVGMVEIINPAGTPRGRLLCVGNNLQYNTITKAAGTGLSVANDANGKPRRVTVAVALAADAEVVQVIAWGFRDIGGSK